MSELVTPNGIKKGSKVLWARMSNAFPRQNNLAKGTLKKNQLYEVTFVFPGDPMQIELEGLDNLYVYDMFQKIK